MPVVHANMATGHGNIQDVQIWTEAATLGLDNCRVLQYLCHVDHTKVPVFLVSNGPFRVYTDDKNTEHYFGENLARYTDSCGLLAKGGSDDTYMVFFGDTNLSIWCFVVDFAALDVLSKVQPHTDKDVYFTGTNYSAAAKSDTTIFDRVLENKTAKVPPQQVHARPISTLVLSSTHQISQAVNKIVLSGLRLRGLSATVGTSNEKIAVREIYQMTRKAAMFSLRKYKYEFNDAKSDNVRMADIQDVVERLLEVFLDVGEPRETLRSR